jgi:hypothetical protein
MFHYDVDPIKKVKSLNIHPDLNIKNLKELITATRKTILKIFIDCENDYKKGIQLYTAITLDKKLIQEKRKIKYHKKMRNKLIMQEEDVLSGNNDTVKQIEPVINKINMEESSMKDETYLEKPLFVRNNI